MIQIYECPNCGIASAAFVRYEDRIYCPACSPTPGTEPHDYQPIMLGGYTLEQVEAQHKEWAQALAPGVWERFKAAIEADPSPVPQLVELFRDGVCCGDAGDCGHECGIG